MIRWARSDETGSAIAWERERRLRWQALNRVARPEHRLVPWIGLWAIVILAQFGALIPVLFERTGPLGSSEVFSLVGGSFAACGLVAWGRRPDSLSGPLMVATGLLSFVYPLFSQLDFAPAVTVGHLFADAWVVCFILLLLTFPTSGRLRAHADRRLVALSAIPLVALQLIYMQFHAEDGNLLLITSNEGIADAVDKIQRISIALACVAVGVVLAVHWRAASVPRRRALLPSVAGAICLLLFAALLVNDLVTGSRSTLLTWFAACSLVSVPLAFLFGLLRSRLARAGLANLFRDLPVMRGAALQAALARAVGDPGLVLAHRMPGGYVDPSGAPVALPPEAGRALTRIARDGNAVAMLVYDGSLDDDPDLVDAVRAAAGIALENEYLQAQSRERTAELRASRERIVAAGDAERRRLERNLHDGAQQRLVGIALQLRLIERRIGTDPAAATQLVNTASDELAHSLSELRELARGIHPAVLNHGLAAALDSLAGPLDGADPGPVRAARPAPGSGRAGGLLRGLRGAGQRRQVRRGVLRGRAGVALGAGRHEHLDRRHRRRRRGRRARLRHPRPERPRRGAGRPSPRGQPARRGHGDHGRVPMRVVVADDNLLIRDGLASLLQDSGIEVVARAGDLDELLRAVDAHRPDLAIVDVRMPPTHTDEGLRAAQEIRARHPEVAIVILSEHVEVGVVTQVLAAQPERLGYLLKQRVTDFGEFLAALRRVAAGGTALDPEIVGPLLAGRHDDGPLSRLTARETEVLQLVAEGQTNKAIAERLEISSSTTRKHVGTIFDKLGLPSGDDAHRRILAVLAYLR